MTMANITEQSEDKKKVTPDQESWIKERVKTAIQMALALDKNRKVHQNPPTGNLGACLLGN